MDPSSASELWHQLETGSWSVVDRVDGDERHVLLAQENAPAAWPDHALTRREREVVGYASRGWSNKVIAYELGVATSTVSTHLSHAASKLGLPSRSAVIQMFVALVARPRPEVAVMHHVHAGKRSTVFAIPMRSTLPPTLSPAEREVVAAVVAGKSNADIAQARGVSRRTIENQLAAAMKKLGTGSRAELAAFLLTQDA